MNNYGSGSGFRRRFAKVSFVSRAFTSLIMVLSVVILTAAPSLGEQRGRERPNRLRVLDILATRLQLSDQQIVAVAPILDEEANRRRELMDRLRVEMDRVDRETADRLAMVLSAEQMAKYDKIIEERRNRGGERQAPPPGQEGAAPRPPRENGQPRLHQ